MLIVVNSGVYATTVCYMSSRVGQHGGIRVWVQCCTCSKVVYVVSCTFMVRHSFRVIVISAWYPRHSISQMFFKTGRKFYWLVGLWKLARVKKSLIGYLYYSPWSIFRKTHTESPPTYWLRWLECLRSRMLEDSTVAGQEKHAVPACMNQIWGPGGVSLSRIFQLAELTQSRSPVSPIGMLLT